MHASFSQAASMSEVEIFYLFFFFSSVQYLIYAFLIHGIPEVTIQRLQGACKEFRILTYLS